MHTSLTYRWSGRVAALLLLFGVALPAGLQAKTLVDFCMTQIQTEATGAHHDCCCPADKKTDTHDGSDCDGNICTTAATSCSCHFDQAPMSDENWTAPKPVAGSDIGDVAVAGPERAPPAYSEAPVPTEPIDHPPLFLLHSSFLN